MEVLIDCYFDRLFEEMERSSLASRHRRRQLVKFFSDVIKSCSEAEDLEKADVCERIVKAALRYHTIAMAENGSVCMLGKFHNVLYVAAKLCYDWKLNNNELVTKILNDMFYCEKTFERIFVGAIFGTRVTHFLSGWKSDFDDRDENLKALVYFLDHAIEGKLEFHCRSISEKRSLRFIDVPMESYGQVLPLRVAVQNGSPDILQIMLRYGASFNEDTSAPPPIEILLALLNEYDADTECPQKLITCLKILLRTIPSIHVRVPEHLAETCGIQIISVYEQYPNLAEKNLLPPQRSGISPPELKHLCRCRVRHCLATNWALPHGIRQLQIPKTLQDYLDLLAD